MRGWLSKASCHSSSYSPSHTELAVSRSNVSFEIGRLAARAIAHARDPQHGNTSRAAASVSRAFQRARTGFIIGVQDSAISRPLGVSENGLAAARLYTGSPRSQVDLTRPRRVSPM